MKPRGTWVVWALSGALALLSSASAEERIANGPTVATCDPAAGACPSDFTIQADGSATQVVADVQGYFRNLRTDQLPAPINPNQVAILRWYAANQTASFPVGPVGSSPLGVAFDGANIWVADVQSNKVSKR